MDNFKLQTKIETKIIWEKEPANEQEIKAREDFEAYVQDFADDINVNLPKDMLKAIDVAIGEFMKTSIGNA